MKALHVSALVFLAIATILLSQPQPSPRQTNADEILRRLMMEQHAEPDLEAVAEEGRLDLRVHHAAHRPPHEGGEDLEVLSAAVQDDRHRRIPKGGEERREVRDRERIDDGDRLPRRHLHHAQDGPVGPLPHELRIDRESARRVDLLHELDELVACGEQVRRGGHGGARYPAPAGPSSARALPFAGTGPVLD